MGKEQRTFERFVAIPWKSGEGGKRGDVADVGGRIGSRRSRGEVEGNRLVLVITG